MKNSSTKALVISRQRALVCIVTTAFFALSLLVAMMPTPARAAALTEPQIEAIMNLLVSFDADEGVISKTENSLRGKSSEAHEDRVVKASVGAPSTASMPPKNNDERGSAM